MGVQRKPKPALGEVRQVEGDMAPPRAVIVPEMMIGVSAPAPCDRFDVCIHAFGFGCQHASEGGLKTKMPSRITTASVFS
jgi:hypothetical protein